MKGMSFAYGRSGILVRWGLCRTGRRHRVRVARKGHCPTRMVCTCEKCGAGTGALTLTVASGPGLTCLTAKD